MCQCGGNINGYSGGCGCGKENSFGGRARQRKAYRRSGMSRKDARKATKALYALRRSEKFAQKVNEPNPAFAEDFSKKATNLANPAFLNNPLSSEGANPALSGGGSNSNALPSPPNPAFSPAGATNGSQQGMNPALVTSAAQTAMPAANPFMPDSNSAPNPAPIAEEAPANEAEPEPEEEEADTPEASSDEAKKKAKNSKMGLFILGGFGLLLIGVILFLLFRKN